MCLVCGVAVSDFKVLSLKRLIAYVKRSLKSKEIQCPRTCTK